MGQKGDKMTQASVITAELLEEKLISIEGISTKKMFGGHGIFYEKKMFGLINSKGFAFLKIPAQHIDEFVAMGAEKHAKMPYYSIPQQVMEEDKLLFWVKQIVG